MQAEESGVVNVDDEKDNAFYCEKCTFKTHYYSRLVSHSVVHSQNRPYACEYCHYAAKRKSDLKKHVVHKHKLSDSKDGASSSKSDRTSSNTSQQQQSQKSIPITYTLSPEQEVAQSPLSVPDDTDEISIHSDSNTPISIKVELNDDAEETNIRHFEYALPTVSSFSDANPVTINIPQVLYPSSQMSTAFTPTISAIGSHIITNSHKGPYSSGVTSQDLYSSSEVQGLVGSKNSSANQSFSPVTIPGPLNVKDVTTMTNQGFFCPHCNILFFDNGLYVLHMGLHHSENPWQCNLCGHVHKDVYSFTLHFITQHKSS